MSKLKAELIKVVSKADKIVDQSSVHFKRLKNSEFIDNKFE